MMNFNLARTNMVKSQLAPNRIHDPRLLTQFNRLKREDFLQQEFRDLAYSDMALPLESGDHPARRLLKPLQLALLAQALEIQKNHRVLIIGAGTAYESTLIAGMEETVDVFALEPESSDVPNDQDHIFWRVGDLSQGWADAAPFDGILLCGAVPEIPVALKQQLSPSGRLIAITGAPEAAILHAICLRGDAIDNSPDILFETEAFHLPDFKQIVAPFRL